jgi:hypothetical protein
MLTEPDMPQAKALARISIRATVIEAYVARRINWAAFSGVILGELVVVGAIGRVGI